jgi:sulfhydrogenase subunit beta (sulfur reductase)
MAKIIQKKNINYFIEELKKKYQVYAPVKKGEEYIFDSIADKEAESICLTYPTTILPPKKFFFPQKETLFEYKNKKIKVSKLEEKSVLFGLHPYDIHGLLILDTVFNHPKVDYYYQERRKNTIVIGINCPSTSPAFFESLGLDVHSGYDLFLNEVSEGFVATAESKEGEKLLKMPFFQSSDYREGITQKSPEKLLADKEKLSRAVQQRKHKIWDDLAKICFGCGICSYVCPVCYCFEVEDQINFDLCSGCRERRWDACFLPNFSEVSGNRNFRAKLRDRSYHWYYHKFVQMPSEIGKIGCVGCGRCTYYCPAKIKFREILEELIKDLDG